MKNTKLYQSFKMLTGNTRTSVVFEPLWGIPYTLYTFYLSLYMKERGVTNAELGYLVAIGAVSAIFFSLFGGIITDTLGRKKTTVIFDLISWPGAILLYMVAHSFWIFVLATVVNNMSKIVSVSWNLMLVEDADTAQQTSACNLINVINLSVGVLTPLAGLIVLYLGVVRAELILMGYAVVSMTTMVLGRNHYYKETFIGRQILEEAKLHKTKRRLNLDSFELAFNSLKKNKRMVLAIMMVILFYTYLSFGTISSLYFAPYMTEVLKLDKPVLAILGGVSAVAMFAVMVFLMPMILHKNKIPYLIGGLAVQSVAMLLLIFIPQYQFVTVLISIVLSSLGIGVTRPFADALLAEVTCGKERAGLYAIYNTSVSVFIALSGLLTGLLYNLWPGCIYLLSCLFLIICIFLLVPLYKISDFSQNEPMDSIIS